MTKLPRSLLRYAVAGALGCGVLALLGAPGADATPAWLVPVNLSQAGENASAPRGALDAQGDAVAVWERSDGSSVVVQGASRPAGGSWQTPVNLSEAGENALAPQIAIDAQGDAVAVWERSDGSSVIVQGASRPAGGSWQAPVNLSEAGENAGEPEVAVDAHGDAVAVWERSDGSSVIVQGASRPAGGSWQTPVKLSEAGQDGFAPQVALDPQDDAVAVWACFNGSNVIVQGASRPAGGSWQTPVNLSEAGQEAFTPQVAVDAQGDAVAVWQRSFIVQGTSRPAGGSWQTPINLSEAGQEAFSPQVAVDRQGDAVAVWERAHEPVQGASKPAAGSWQTPVNLTEAGEESFAPKVAVDALGDAVAVWDRFDGSNDIVQGVSKLSGGSWQTPVNLSEAGQHAGEPQVAVDAQGDAVAAWPRSYGTNEVVQAAGYDAAGPLLNGLLIPTSGSAGQPLTFSVSPLDVWSALGATSWSFGDGAAATGTSVMHTYPAAGIYHVTLASSDVLGNASSASRAITITPAAAIPPPRRITPAPTITRVAQSHSTWREGGKLAQISRSKKKPPVGTSFSFVLNEQASVNFSFTQRVSGRKLGHKCLAKTKKNQGRKSCQRTVTIDTLTFTGHTGANKVVFQGRISRAKKLKPGRYTLIITARNSTGASRPQSLSFTIVK